MRRAIDVVGAALIVVPVAGFVLGLLWSIGAMAMDPRPEWHWLGRGYLAIMAIFAGIFVLTRNDRATKTTEDGK